MKLKILSLIFVSLGLMNCASAPVPRQIAKTFPIAKSFDTVWPAVIESFADLNFPYLDIEKDSGLITTGWIDFTGQSNEEYADCGGLGLNSEVLRVGRLNVFVKKVDENSCEVRVNCLFEQEIRFGDSPVSKKKCVSTGNLEAEIFNLIKTKTGI